MVMAVAVAKDTTAIGRTGLELAFEQPATSQVQGQLQRTKLGRLSQVKHGDQQQRQGHKRHQHELSAALRNHRTSGRNIT